MNDGQSAAAIWLGGNMARSIVDIVNICDASQDPVNGDGRRSNSRELLYDAGVAFHLAGRQLGVHPASSYSSVHTGL